MHALIAHFRRILPTWLLLELDWASTKQAAPFMPSCSDMKWIEGSKHTGKDNYAWYRFHIRHSSGPVFHWRDQGEAIPRRSVVCEQCGRAHEPQRSSSRFCSPACKQTAYRNRLSVTPSVTTPAPLPDTQTESPESGEMFRYVRYDDVERLEAEGWEVLPALDGTHHAAYAVLMRRRSQQDERPLIG